MKRVWAGMLVAAVISGAPVAGSPARAESHAEPPTAGAQPHRHTRSQAVRLFAALLFNPLAALLPHRGRPDDARAARKPDARSATATATPKPTPTQAP